MTGKDGWLAKSRTAWPSPIATMRRGTASAGRARARKRSWCSTRPACCNATTATATACASATMRAGWRTLREATALGARTAFQLRQSYDPCGRLQEQRADGVALFGVPAGAGRGAPPQPAAFARCHEWDRAGRLAGLTEETGEQARYRYDARDQILAVERPGRNETYRYDALMNLAEACRAIIGTGATASCRRAATGSATTCAAAWWSASRRLTASARDSGATIEKASTGWSGSRRRRGALALRLRRVRAARPQGADRRAGGRRVDYVWQGEMLAEA